MNVSAETSPRDGIEEFDARRIAQLFARLTFFERSIAFALEKPETLSVKMLEAHAQVNSARALLRAEQKLDAETGGYTPPATWLAWFEHVHRDTVARLKKEIAGLPAAGDLPARSDDDWRGCIYISYAREDEKVAEAVARQLDDAGLLVWLDRSALKPGQNWATAMRKVILESSGAFIALISNSSASRQTGHFLEERMLAAERLRDFASGRSYYFPVRIDDGHPVLPATEPEAVQTLHAVRAPGGRLDRQFIETLREIQRGYRPEQPLP